VKSAIDELGWTLAEPLYRVKADMFKGLAHPVRVRILELLVGQDEVPVTELMRDIGLEPSHLSQHLAVLRRHRLVTSDRRASYVYYRLAFPEVADLLTAARRLLVLSLEASQEQLTATGALPAIGAGAVGARDEAGE
jgi:ArsR family transcriptional regulator